MMPLLLFMLGMVGGLGAIWVLLHNAIRDTQRVNAEPEDITLPDPLEEEFRRLEAQVAARDRAYMVAMAATTSTTLIGNYMQLHQKRRRRIGRGPQAA